MPASQAPVADRASATDLAFLAMDTGAVPQQIGAILLLAPGHGVDPNGVRRLLAERIPAIPRLRQRLVRVPPGCGRRIWVDDPAFDIGDHVRQVPCRSPGDERALLDTAVEVVTEPLPPSRPRWAAVCVTGPAGAVLALVVVVHHVLVDGIGGLAVLAGLVDGTAAVPPAPFPRRPPPLRRLAADTARTRLGALARMPRAWQALRVSMTASGGLAPTRAAPCSLVARTGPHRRLAVVRADLPALRAAAHREGATVNDAVLVAVAGALCRVLRGRGESLDAVAVAVPVAGRRSATAAQLGNQVAPLLVTVPVTGDRSWRLRQVATAVVAGKDAATGPPPIAVLGPVFRAAAALGAYRWYMNHQHRMHTLVSSLRGAEQPVTFGGAAVESIVPVSVAEAGNLTVAFVVLSYAGTLTITAVADPDRFADLDVLADALRTELALLT